MGLQLPSIGVIKTLGSNMLPRAFRAVHGLGKGLEFAAKLDQKMLDPSGEGDLLLQVAGLLQIGTPSTQAPVRKTGGPEPPGTSPPQSADEKAAVPLERRKTAGQKNEISGPVLDAKSAKELPAQQQSPRSADPSAEVLTALLRAAQTAPTAAPPPQNTGAQQSAGAQGAPLQSAVAAQNAAPAQTAAVLPDILTRMLTRAANAQAQRTGEVAQTSASSTAASPSAMFEHLVEAIAQRSSAQNDSNADDDSEQTFASAAPPSSTPSGERPAQGALSGTPVFQVQAAPAAVPSTSAQPAATSFARIDPAAIIEQVVKGMTMRSSGSTSEVRMRLQPDHLGDVALKITLNGNTMSANVVAQSAHVRDLLLANQQQLARALSQAGLTLGKFSVDVSGGNAGFTQQQGKQQRAVLKAGAFGAALAGEDEAESGTRFGPPIITTSKSLVLNYLV